MQAHLFGRPEVTRILLLEPTGVLVGLAPYRALRTELHARGFTADGGADAPGTTRTPGEAPDPVVAADASEHLTNLGQNLASLDNGTATAAAAATSGAAAAAAAAAAAEAEAAARETDAAAFSAASGVLSAASGAFSAASGVRTLRISLARFEGRTLDRRLVETLCAVRAADCT